MVVNRESVVTLDTNRYSVPVAYVGQALTARIHEQRIDLFSGTQLVASHRRNRGKQQRIIDPIHFEEVFAVKPRARVVVYRDWLIQQSAVLEAYLSQICQRRRDEWAQHVSALYLLLQTTELPDVVGAIELAMEQGGYGVEYVQALLDRPAPAPKVVPLHRTVERDLEHYERYVANRDMLLASGGDQ